MKRQWTLSQFDLFCLTMTIKGAWVYTAVPSYSDLQASLKKLLKMYPQLGGFYSEQTKSISWDDSAEPSVEFKQIACPEHTISEDPYKLVPTYNIKGFKEGKVKALEAYLLTLKDGSALVVQGAHAAMDGFSFYNLVGQWGQITSGKDVTPMLCDQSLLPKAEDISKDDAMKMVIEDGWTKMTLGKVIKMLSNIPKMNSKKAPFVIEVSQVELQKMKADTGCGSNAVLCAYACKALMDKVQSVESYSILEVAESRKYVKGIPENFFGNLSQPFAMGETFSRNETKEAIAKRIQTLVKENLNTAKVDRRMRLSVSAADYSLPYHYFDASKMNCRKPEIIYINNQIGLKANEVEFGTGLPVYVHDAKLPDFVKIWQPVKDGPVQIMFFGIAADIMRKG